jgi:hypothetical protein
MEFCFNTSNRTRSIDDWLSQFSQQHSTSNWTNLVRTCA